MENVNFKDSSSNASNKEGKREKAVLNIKEYEKFPNLVDCAYVNLVDVMESVSKLFSGIFKDFSGCMIKPYPQGPGFNVELYFSMPVDAAILNSGLPSAFEPITLNPQTKNNSPILTAYENMNIRANKKIYNITDDGRDLLSEFFPNNLRKRQQDGFGEPDWNKWTAEVPADNSFNASIYAIVRGLDLHRILSKIYGEKDENGQYYQYQVLPIKPIASNPMFAPTQSNIDWLVSIQRLGMKELDKLARKAGLINSNGIPMIGRR